jgi:hypothetical protein
MWSSNLHCTRWPLESVPIKYNHEPPSSGGPLGILKNDANSNKRRKIDAKGEGSLDEDAIKSWLYLPISRFGIRYDLGSAKTTTSIPSSHRSMSILQLVKSKTPFELKCKSWRQFSRLNTPAELVPRVLGTQWSRLSSSTFRSTNQYHRGVCYQPEARTSLSSSTFDLESKTSANSRFHLEGLYLLSSYRHSRQSVGLLRILIQSEICENARPQTEVRWPTRSDHCSLAI